MKLKTVIIDDWHQSFVSSGTYRVNTPDALDASTGEKIKDELPSMVIRLNNRQQILKLVKGRQWLEYIKLLWGRSRISKEIRGNMLLQQIGIRVPGILETGLGLIPSRGYRFIGYYLMDDLEANGYMDAKIAFMENRLSEEARHHCISCICRDVTTMKNHSIVFNDFKLNNIFCNASGDTIWIDTGISLYPFYQRSKLRQKHNFAMDRFIKRHVDLLTPAEKQQIIDLKMQ